MRNNTILLLPFLIGCSQAPYEVGHEVQYRTLADSVTKDYRMVEGSDPVESIGLFGGGETCADAQQSLGSETTEATEETVSFHKVIGTTRIDHPLKPDPEGFGRYRASLVELTERTTSSELTIRGDYYLEEGSYTLSVSESYSDDGVETEAGYYAVAHDEYLIKFELDQLWDLQAYEFISRANPQKGDFWVSASGNVLFVYQGKEDFALPDGSEVKADRVEMYEATNIQKNGQDLFVDCFYQDSDQDVYDDNDPLERDDTAFLTSSLDPGCSDAFIHYQVGTQLWYENHLVQEQKTYQEITINAHGYQTLDETEDNCSVEISWL